MKYFFLLIVIFLTSCGSPDIPHDIDPYFDKFLVHFKHDADAYGIDYGDIRDITIIKFGDVSNSDRQSECKVHEISNRYFGINTVYKEITFQDYVKNLDEQMQYQLFLHEIGHCAYHLGHNPQKYTIMYSYGIEIPILDFKNQLKIYFDDAKSNRKNWFSFDPTTP